MKNKSKRRQRIFALLACVCLVCSMFVVSSYAEDTITDLTGTTWTFNNSISIPPTNPIWYLDFEVVSTSVEFSSFAFSSPSFSYRSGSTDTWVYNNGSWLDDSYKTITISGGSYSANASVIAWLSSNAVQVIPPP